MSESVLLISKDKFYDSFMTNVYVYEPLLHIYSREYYRPSAYDVITMWRYHVGVTS